jgi:predicted nucleic acid-binding protein
MTGKVRVLIDVNVVLDVLAKREPHHAASAAAWALVECGVVEGVVAGHTVTTLHTLVSRHLDHRQANVVIAKLLEVFEAATIDRDVLVRALALAWRDFEDAVQMAAASCAQADYLVTRNPRDFQGDLVRVIRPNDLIALFRAS